MTGRKMPLASMRKRVAHVAAPTAEAPAVEVPEPIVITDLTGAVIRTIYPGGDR